MAVAIPAIPTFSLGEIGRCMSRLEQKVVLVTGGASGLGKAIAVRLLSDGARVVISDIRATIGAQVAEKCGFTFIAQNVCDERRWSDVVSEIEGMFGALHILVNNAGIVGPVDGRSPEDTRLEAWRTVFAVNVEGVFLGCRAAIPAIKRAGGGSIVNLSSVAGLLATPYNTAYGASKAAIAHLTKSVAQHCAHERNQIRCNAVYPGNIRTPLWDKQAQELAQQRGVPIAEIIAEGEAVIPLGEFTAPEDVAAAVSFLVSDDSRHITGSKLIVDGGILGCDTYSMVSRR